MLATVVRIVQVSLGALAAYLLYAAIAPLVGETSVPEAVIPDGSPMTEQAFDRGRYDVISERNLFRTVEAALPPEPEPAEETIEGSTLRLNLLVTAVFGSPELSSAVVTRDGSDEVEVVRIGDDIDGATVERIERRRLVIRNQGKLEQITLDDQQSPGAAASAKAASSRQERLAKARERAKARREAARAARSKRLDRSRPAQPQPSPEEAPSPAGAEAMAALAEVQLEEGERIVSFNGVPADDLDMDALMNASGPPWRVRIADGTGTEREVVFGETR